MKGRNLSGVTITLSRCWAISIVSCNSVRSVWIGGRLRNALKTEKPRPRSQSYFALGSYRYYIIFCVNHKIILKRSGRKIFKCSSLGIYMYTRFASFTN